MRAEFESGLKALRAGLRGTALNYKHIQNTECPREHGLRCLIILYTSEERGMLTINRSTVLSFRPAEPVTCICPSTIQMYSYLLTNCSRIHWNAVKLCSMKNLIGILFEPRLVSLTLTCTGIIELKVIASIASVRNRTYEISSLSIHFNTCK